jgi:uncharacterized protein YndB with AHSA1/START domain
MSFKTITISEEIKTTPQNLYKIYLDPQDNLCWNYASEGWTTPFAEIDAKVGGIFKIGYQSPDRKNDFTFEGKFVEMVENQKISYKIGDGRPVVITFEQNPNNPEFTTINLTLALEDENTAEMQRQGWGMILKHLKDYTEKQVKA